jgi:hypothetical protein
MLGPALGAPTCPAVSTSLGRVACGSAPGGWLTAGSPAAPPSLPPPPLSADAFGTDQWLLDLRRTVRAAIEQRKQVLVRRGQGSLRDGQRGLLPHPLSAPFLKSLYTDRASGPADGPCWPPSVIAVCLHP